MDLKLYDICDQIVNDFLNNENVKEYIKLNNLIEEKYYKELLMFNTCKEALDEAKKYHLDTSKQEINLVKSKEQLYSLDEVKRIKQLEREIQKALDLMTNEISEFISNKIKKKRVIEWRKEEVLL